MTKKKKVRVVNTQEVGNFYIIDYANGWRVITGKDAAKEVAARLNQRQKKRRRKK